MSTSKPATKKYQTLETLGEGAFGDVVLVQDNGRLLCLKKISKTVASKASVLSELKVAKQLSNVSTIKSNILLPVRVESTRTHWLIFTEYLEDYVTVDEWYNTKDQPVSDQAKILNTVVTVLSVVHSKGFAHRDIKPSNIMIRTKDLHVKLIDFGLSCFDRVCEQSFGGTSLYQSPKLIKHYVKTDNGWTTASVVLHLRDFQQSDVWAVGMIAVTFISGGAHPFSSYYDTIFTLQALYFSPITQEVCQKYLDKWNADTRKLFHFKKELLKCDLASL